MGELLESVFYKGDEVLIERNGKVMGVVIPPPTYERLSRDREEAMDRMFALLEKNWERNKDIDLEDLEQDIDQAIREVRAEMAAERRRAK